MLLKSIDNVLTERVTEEVQDVIQDLGQVDSKDRKYTWNGDDINRLYAKIFLFHLTGFGLRMLR